MKVLVTGAAGMLGLDLQDALREGGHDVIAHGRDTLDVTDAGAVRRGVSEASPDAVVNCAAFTDVDGAEDEFQRALEVNVGGATNVAAAASEVGALVVYVSTDYVFDGRKGEPYVEDDETGPVQAYGETKLAGERATADANERHQIVRSSWLFGVRGHNFVETMLGAAAAGRDLRVVDDQVGSPTYTRHLAAGITQLIASGATGIHHMAGGGAVSWHGFATEIFRQAGVEASLEACSTQEFPRPAERPAISVLGSEREDTPGLPAWQEGLAAYLEERGGAGAAAMTATGEGDEA